MIYFSLQKRLLPMLSALFLTGVLMAQGKVNFTLQGSVKDGNDPIIGASVVLDNTTIGSITDVDGKYTFSGSATEGAHTVNVSFIGYSTSKQAITLKAGSQTLDITLNSDVLNLDEVVVTGNNSTTTRKQLGNSISVIKSESLKNSGTTSTLGALQGKVMGAQISQNSGDPAGGISVRLRGAGSVNGSSEPLYIVDGIIVDNSSQNVINRNADAQTTGFSAGQNRLVDLNPNDIDRIEVINGAAAAALYGSRAGNGVVQIFTKRGKSDKTRIEFSTAYMSSQLRKSIPMTTYGKRFGVKGNDRLETAQDRLTILLNLYPADAGKTQAQTMTDKGIKFASAGYTPRFLITDQYDVTRYNYFDEIFQTAGGTDNSLSFSGGNDKTQYYASLGFYDNDGIIKNTNFKKYNLRLNLDQTLSSWAKLSLGLAANFSKSKDMPNGNNFFNPISSIFIIDNVWNLSDRDGAGNLKQVEQVRMNPLSIIETFDISQRTYRTTGNAKLSLYPIKGLTIDMIAGGDMYSLTGNQYQPRVSYVGVSSDFFPDGYVSTATSNVMLLNNDFTANYKADLAKDITSNTTVGYQIQYNRSQITGADGRNLAPFGKTLSAASTPFTASFQGIGERLISGVFAQQTFSYKEQLFVTGAVRMDKSSIFAAENQNNLYPKISASWLLNDYIKNKDIISSAKLRVAYGIAGNLTGIGDYDRYDNYGISSLGGLTSVQPSTRFANPSVRPEKKRELEYGADLAFLKNRIGLSVNLYSQKVTDLLLTKPLPPTVGGTSIVTNISADSTYMSNKGVEVMLNVAVIKTKDFKWDIGALYSANVNKVFGIDGGFIFLRPGGPQAVMTGQPFGAYYGNYYARKADGTYLLTTQNLYQTARGTQTVAQYAQGTEVLGADGQPALTGTTQLRKILGNPAPKWTGSLTTNMTYKKFSLYALFDAAQGFSVYNWNRITSNNVGWGPLADKELKGEVPRGTVASVAGGINGNRIQQEHIEDGSYVKLREIALTYDLGKLKGVFENVNISLIGRNLMSWDKYQGFDPETNSAGQSDKVRGDDFGNVPIPRTVMARLNVRF